MKANALSADKFEARVAVDGSHYFVLKAANGAIIGVSQMYATASNSTRAINAVVAMMKLTFTQAPVVIGARFETFKGLDNKYYFHARAANGEIVLQSQSYTTNAKAKAGVASVQSNGLVAARYTVLAAVDGRFYFTLKATNGQVIARSQLYSTKYSAERGVETVMALVKPVSVD